MGRSKRILHENRPGAYFICASVLTLVWWIVLSRPASPPAASKSNPAASPAKRRSALYPVFPYSVVAGGAHSPADLRLALARDPLVAAHYAGFASENARVVSLPAARAAYVSFRFRNRIYWTRRPILLPKGELLITDGRNFARVRCGNRLSSVPQPNASPNQPPDSLMELTDTERSFFEQNTGDAEASWSSTPSDYSETPGAESAAPPIMAEGSTPYPADTVPPVWPAAAGVPPATSAIPPGFGTPSVAKSGIVMPPAELARETAIYSPVPGHAHGALGVTDLLFSSVPPSGTPAAVPAAAQPLFPVITPVEIAPRPARVAVYPVGIPRVIRSAATSIAISPVTSDIVLEATPPVIPIVMPIALPLTPGETAAVAIPALAAPILTPEPGTLLLAGSSLALLLAWRRKGAMK